MTYENFVSIIENSTLSDYLTYEDGEYISKKDLNVRIVYHKYSNIYDEVEGEYEDLISVSDISAFYGTSLIVLAKCVTVGTEDRYEVKTVDKRDDLVDHIAKLVSRS